EYMVPSVFVFLDELPLSPSGKLDRKALPIWNAPSKEGPGEGDEGPRSPVEEALAAVWREVLARNDFGIHADFFDLGGHSLSATQVASRISEMFQVEVPLQTFFERPTIAAFAIAVEQAVMAQIEALPHAEIEGLEVENG
ncbi:MAG: phosphopantetheine-binding protein, partial [Vicinamibacteria bacterium]